MTGELGVIRDTRLKVFFGTPKRTGNSLYNSQIKKADLNSEFRICSVSVSAA
jgi:hypothetical protein